MPLFGSKPPTVRERIDDLLNDIAKASTSVRAVVLFRNDGLLVASQPADLRIEGASGQFTAILESVTKLSTKFGLGEVNYILVSGENAAFVIVRGKKLNLAVIGEKDLNLGFFLTQAESVLSQCEKAIG